MTNENGNRVSSSKHQAVTKPFLFTSPPNRATANGSSELEATVKDHDTNNERDFMGNHCRRNGAVELRGSDYQSLGRSEPSLGLV